MPIASLDQNRSLQEIFDDGNVMSEVMHVGESSYGKVTVVPFVVHCVSDDRSQTRFICDFVDTGDTLPSSIDWCNAHLRSLWIIDLVRSPFL